MRARLATINLQAANPERSKRFYLDVLGLVEDAQRSHPPAFVYLRSGGCDVTIAAPPEADGGQPSRAVELGFEVDDLAAMRAHLSAHGIRNYREESMGWGEALELCDSDGHRVVIYSFKREDGPGNRPPA
jgi:catechol 2,3-dioxygenase-like lactoylglutathione lyase family enzyme